MAYWPAKRPTRTTGTVSYTHLDVYKRQLDYHSRLKPQALQGARIGVLRSKFSIHPDAAAAMEVALQTLHEAGATLVDVEIPTEGQWQADETLSLIHI